MNENGIRRRPDCRRAEHEMGEHPFVPLFNNREYPKAGMMRRRATSIRNQGRSNGRAILDLSGLAGDHRRLPEHRDTAANSAKLQSWRFVVFSDPETKRGKRQAA